jgi:HD-GYP domain-containing protein (c-di-GMP phosphodiesterase class II)
VGGHHEQYGGEGYPKRLRGEEIPIAARIFSLADVFDALTSRRPYKEAFSLEKTLEILKEGRGVHFDPALLDVFARLAPDLYERFSGREDAGLREELDSITHRYFTGGMETLTYG